MTCAMGMALAYLLAIPIAHVMLFPSRNGQPRPMGSWLFELLCAMTLACIAYRVLYVHATPRDDHLTYRMIEYWFTLVCASTVYYPLAG